MQRKLGAPIGIAFDVQAVCSGFVYALAVADNFVARGQSKCALVIGAETMTRLMDWTDRGTCVLFGDGAGAVVLEPGEGQGTTADRGVLGVALRADGTKQDLLYVDGGPSTTGTVGKLRMQGNQVFRHAVVNISEAVIAAAKAAGVVARRGRLVHPAPGQPAHPGRRGAAARHRRDAGDLHRRRARQHLGRVDPAGAGAGHRRRPHQARPAAADGGDGRRPDLGRGRRPALGAESDASDEVFDLTKYSRA